jgi:hypothetical protein
MVHSKFRPLAMDFEAIERKHQGLPEIDVDDDKPDLYWQNLYDYSEYCYGFPKGSKLQILFPDGRPVT